MLGAWGKGLGKLFGEAEIIEGRSSVPDENHLHKESGQGTYRRLAGSEMP